jgi:large subunit ribosomal protein L9
MKVILRQSVENLGRPGDVVKVRDGYARNYLLPQKLALPFTAGNVKQIEKEKQRLAVKEAKLKSEADAVAARFVGTRLVFTKKAGEEGVLYGSVTTAEIAEAMAHKGLEIDKRRLIVADAIKRVGEFVVKARLHPEVELDINVVVEPEGGMETLKPAAAQATPTPPADAGAQASVEKESAPKTEEKTE